MNRALPILSLCIALLALAGALIPRDPVVLPPSQPEAPRGMDVDAELLRRRVELLEDDNRALWDRVVLLERRQGSALSTDAGSAGLVSEIAQLRQEVRGVMTGEMLSNEASRAALKEVIREAEAENQRERIAQRQERQEQRAAEQKAKWKAFISTAKLTWQQEQELTKRLDAEETARQAFAQQLQSGTPPNPEAFRALRDQRKETDQAMSKLLDGPQQEQYQAMRREDRGGGRRGGDRETPEQPR